MDANERQHASACLGWMVCVRPSLTRDLELQFDDGSLRHVFRVEYDDDDDANDS
jgi:hypothetical protein